MLSICFSLLNTTVPALLLMLTSRLPLAVKPKQIFYFTNNRYRQNFETSSRRLINTATWLPRTGINIKTMHDAHKLKAEKSLLYTNMYTSKYR